MQLSRDDDDGYTLLELLVATVLGGFLLIAVSGALTYTGSSRAHSDRVEARSRDTDAAIQMVARILGNAQPVLNSPSYADRRIEFDGSTEAVQFVGRLPNMVGEDQTAKEELSLLGTGPARDLCLSWSSTLPSAQVDAIQPSHHLKIIGEIRSLRFGFYGADRPLHKPVWRSSWTGLTSLPLLVSVEIDEARAGTVRPTLFFVAPKVSATPACRFDPENVSCRRVQ